MSHFPGSPPRNVASTLRPDQVDASADCVSNNARNSPGINRSIMNTTQLCEYSYGATGRFSLETVNTGASVAEKIANAGQHYSAYPQNLSRSFGTSRSADRSGAERGCQSDRAALTSDAHPAGQRAETPRPAAEVAADLLTRALELDFHGRLTYACDLEAVGADHAAATIEDWQFDNGLLPDAAAHRAQLERALLREASGELARREIAEADEAAAIADAIEHGDCDADGNWIPYAKSYLGSVA